MNWSNTSQAQTEKETWRSSERNTLERNLQITSRPHSYWQHRISLFLTKEQIDRNLSICISPGSAWEGRENWNMSGWETWWRVLWRGQGCPGLAFRPITKFLGQQQCTAGFWDTPPTRKPNAIHIATQSIPTAALGWNYSTKVTSASVNPAIRHTAPPNTRRQLQWGRIGTPLCSCWGGEGVLRCRLIGNRIDLF